MTIAGLHLVRSGLLIKVLDGRVGLGHVILNMRFIVLDDLCRFLSGPIMLGLVLMENSVLLVNHLWIMACNHLGATTMA